MLLVCLNVASVLPVFSCVASADGAADSISFKANGQTISLRWFMADASDLDSLHDALISQWSTQRFGRPSLTAQCLPYSDWASTSIK